MVFPGIATGIAVRMSLRAELNENLGRTREQQEGPSSCGDQINRAESEQERV
jgi:hypothetical protein